ncbi:hypothetical protein P879_03597 [Paragonimus westermani]|uniref:Tyrosine-protein kinase ephrin type A/B receptor-like domain-containing protein n=1 Tax=Paragonimus westermani TaxID=34504 RepID=A0A8T0DTK7_9TREM|nr:hypothetical protein P879_03597 [Paragonimus westermani]
MSSHMKLALEQKSPVTRSMCVNRLIILVYLFGFYCLRTEGHNEQHCDMRKLRPFRQTIQLADSGDGFTEMVPPDPEIRHIWPSEMASLFYQFSRPTIRNKVWLYQTTEGESYRLRRQLEDFSCFELGEKETRDPFEQSFYLKTSLDGIYMFAEYDTNWKLPKNLKTHKGRNEIYTPLKTYVVLELKPAKIGLVLRLAGYEPFENCSGAHEKMEWVMKSLQNLRATSSKRPDLATVDGDVQYEVIGEHCRQLSDDSSPTYVSVYYNIDGARITPNGFPYNQERPWIAKGEPIYRLKGDETIVIPLPQPFGSVTRIRLNDFTLSPKDEINITLKTRSEEAMSEAFWGPGNEKLPFPEEQATPYVFATVRLNQTLFHEVCTQGKHKLDWMLIEPMYGRVRTSSGVMIAMNVWDSWVNAQFVTEVIIEKTGDSRKDMKIGSVVFEQPQHPEDVNEMLRLIHEQRPLPGAMPKFGRACLTKVHGFATSSYYVHLERPSKCIEWDRTQHSVYKKTGSIRSALTSYTIQLLYDDFGDELVNATGAIAGHIQLVSFSRKSRKMTHIELDCPKQNTQEGETMRIGFVVDRIKDEIQYLARWEDRWVQHLGYTNQVAFIELNETNMDRWASTPKMCPPERTMVDFVYELDTRNLRVKANDTDKMLLNATLSKHPMWLGLEIFVDQNAPLCVGCFVYVQIDRRGVHHNRPTQWPAVDFAVNEWSQIHYPRQANSKAMWTAIVSISQTYEKRVALEANPKNSQRRLLEITRKLANPINLSVALVGAASFCPPGQYMPYGTPAVCVECPPGTQSRILNENTSFAVHVCEQCPRGTYQEIPGQTKCNKCAPGQTTLGRGSWSRRSCGPNVTTDGIFVSNTRGVPIKGEPYVMVESSSTTKDQTYGWTKDEDEDEFQTFEGPGELNMVSTGRLVFNMVSLVLLLGCIMVFVATSMGYMLIWVSQKTRRRRPTMSDKSRSTENTPNDPGRRQYTWAVPDSTGELTHRFRDRASSNRLSSSK